VGQNSNYGGQQRHSRNVSHGSAYYSDAHRSRQSQSGSRQPHPGSGQPEYPAAYQEQQAAGDPFVDDQQYGQQEHEQWRVPQGGYYHYQNYQELDTGQQQANYGRDRQELDANQPGTYTQQGYGRDRQELDANQPGTWRATGWIARG
jgi:hypothetical protein